MEDSARPIRIVVINGSVRPHNYTSMASAYVVDELRKHPKVSVEEVHPGDLNLPFPGTDPNSPATKKLQQIVGQATGVVLVTPEYHGSFSSVMKLVIENLGFPSVLAGKPVALLGVAAGTIGAIKSLEHLRGVVSHVGGHALPLPISIANVQKVFDREGHIAGSVGGEDGAPGRDQPARLHREEHLPVRHAGAAPARRPNRSIPTLSPFDRGGRSRKTPV